MSYYKVLDIVDFQQECINQNSQNKGTVFNLDILVAQGFIQGYEGGTST